MKIFIAISLLFLTGCQITASSPRTGLWVNREVKCQDCDDWNVKLRVSVMERFVRPIPDGDSNPWQGAKPKAVWHTYMPVAPFFSVGVHDYGAYLGFKRFDYTEKHRDRYWWWPEEWKDDYGEYVTISSRMTTNRCDKE